MVRSAGSPRSRRELAAALGAALTLAASGAAHGQTAPDSLTGVCNALPGGTATTAQPTLLRTLFDRWHEAWLGSPAVADLTGNGSREIIAAREQKVLAWNSAGTVVFDETAPEGRIWSSPVVGDLLPGNPFLEIAAASRGVLHFWNSSGTELPGFPISWRDEMRALAAGQIDGDAALELVVATTNPLDANGQSDLLKAYNLNGTTVAGYPPNTSGASGCIVDCNITGGYDQNLALGDLDGDGADDVVAPHDNAYLSVHDQNGFMYDAALLEYPVDDKVAGVRFLHDPALAALGYSPNEAVDNQAHFTNSPPAIADLDGDGTNELVVLASVQNAAQTDRLRGVALWLIGPDAGRREGWEWPLHFPQYLAGLWDLCCNIVGATNQVAIGDLDRPSRALEMVFAGFDGRIHAVRSNRTEAWSYTYTTDPEVLTGGVVLADLTRDGRPEVIFNTYSTDTGKGKLFILGPDGALQRQIALPDRGAMPVPTVADTDLDGDLEIVVSLKDGVDQVRQLLVYTVPGSSENCLPWPTGRGNYLRNGFSAFLPSTPLFANGFESGNTNAWSDTVP